MFMLLHIINYFGGAFDPAFAYSIPDAALAKNTILSFVPVSISKSLYSVLCRLCTLYTLSAKPNVFIPKIPCIYVFQVRALDNNRSDRY